MNGGDTVRIHISMRWLDARAWAVSRVLLPSISAHTPVRARGEYVWKVLRELRWAQFKSYVFIHLLEYL